MVLLSHHTKTVEGGKQPDPMASLVPSHFLLLIFCLFLVTTTTSLRPRRQHFPGLPRAERTRSLSGTPATDGDNRTNDEIFHLITMLLFKGFAVFRVKGYNDRVYLEKFRRSYWFGNRYYYLDNLYYLATRDTCAYQLNATQRENLFYTDGTPIMEVIYQCQRFVDFCCGLSCCRNDELRPHREPPYRPPQTPWSGGSLRSPSSCLALLSSLPILLMQTL